MDLQRLVDIPGLMGNVHGTAHYVTLEKNIIKCCCDAGNCGVNPAIFQILLQKVFGIQAPLNKSNFIAPATFLGKTFISKD